jgi:isoleucyl-tRNA synthetase
MAPFLSFTAEEAWKSFGASPSIFFETFSDLGTPDAALLSKWNRIREVRDVVNKDIEAVRAEGKVGASLQANITVTAHAEDHALLASLGDDLKFVFITSKVTLLDGDALSVQVSVSEATKCDRCWHYADDVGHDAAHPTLCGRCTSNLYGAGETRTVA